MPRISRRRFARIFSMAGLAGTALMEKMFAEMQQSGSISSETMQSFLDLSGMKIPDNQVAALRASLERAIEGLRPVREWNVPQSIEPAPAFRARR